MKKWKAQGKFSTGFEMEMFTLDRYGNIVFAADSIISHANKYAKEIHVTHEVGRHMVEIGVDPSSDVRECISNGLRTLDSLWQIAEKNSLLLYPFATYPGRFHPKLNKSFWYEMQKKLWGEDKFLLNGVYTGFHFHFEISDKMFSRKKGGIISRASSKESDLFMSSYNFLIAADPAVTTFMQSSPFVQGRYLAKDSRMLIYRGGENLRHEGFWSDLQLFGGLQSYVHTITDLVKLIEKRYDIFKSQLMYWGFDPKLIAKYARKLDTAWNPVKVNKHGTFEQRGMDMNLPSYSAGVTVLLHNALKRIINERLVVVPSDIGIYKPFLVEGKTLYVPPISVVQEQYQYLSAVEGLANAKISRYCKSMCNFASEALGKGERKLLARIHEMLNTRKTISDRLIDEIKSKDMGEYLTKDASAELAEKWCYEFIDDIDYTRKLIR